MLFIIKILEGEHEGNLLRYCVPSFDLRFPYEASYLLRKMLGEQWTGLGNRLNQQLYLDQRAAAKQASGKKPKVTAVEKPSEGPEATGFARPIQVKENEFLLRFRKREGTAIFDREQAESWYEKYLGEIFPDFFEIPETASIAEGETEAMVGR